MKVNVNLFAPTGKWQYGGIVEVSENHAFWSVELRREVLANQKFVMPGTFENYAVVITHRDDYDTDPSPYFCQGMWPAGTFTNGEPEKRLYADD